jgi:acetolactate synthase I/II/III large subunit
MALYNSLYKAEDIRHIMSRDERHAGYMADAYARVSGKPGVCEVPSGGGVSYLLPAVAEADGSSIPLVCLASDVPLASDEKAALTALNQTALMAPITRFSHRLTSAEMIPHMIRKAFRLATSGRTGPVHLAFPENVLSGQANLKLLENDIYAEERCASYPSFRARPDSSLVEKAAALIMKANRPVIIAGGGVLLSGACNELNQLAEYANLAVVTTINGKGSIAETSVLAFGVMGTNGAKASTNSALQEADLILAIGTRLNSSITMSSTLINGDADLIQVDSDPEQLGNTNRVEIAIQADARLFLEDLLTALKEHRSSPLPLSEWVISAREKIDREFTEINRLTNGSSNGVLHPAVVVQILEAILPAETIIVSDAGYSTPYLSAYYRLKKAGPGFIDPRAQGGLGYAIPAAIGAKLAAPEGTPVIGIFGDGSLGMSIGELETVTRLNIPVIYIHFNNKAFGWIQNIQKIYYQKNYFSVSFDPTVDYVKAAEAHGLKASRADSAASLKKVLTGALKSAQATFIEVPIPSGAELTPLVAPWLRDEAMKEEDRCKDGY